MKKAIASVGLLALGAAGVQTAHADWAAGVDKPWALSGTLRGFYDDNYLTLPEASHPRSTFGFELRPSASLNYSSGPTVVTGSYTYSARYLADQDSNGNNPWDQSHDFEFYLSHNFNERYALDVEESFVASREPQVVDPSAPASSATALSANQDNYRNTAGFNFHAEITRLLGVVVGYSDTWYDYTGDKAPNATSSFASLLNRYEDDFVFNTRWHIQEQTTGILGYTFGVVSYTQNDSITAPPNAPVSPKTRDNYTHDLYLGIEHAFRSDLTFSGRGGVQIVDYYHNPVGGNFTQTSPFADVSMSYTYMDGGSVVVGFRHAKNQTDQVGTSGQPTQDAESSTVSVSINQTLTPLSPKLAASLSGQYQNSVYNSGSINDQSDDFYLLGLNLTYQFTHYISAEAGYNYSFLNSGNATLQARGYNRNLVYLGVTATY